jgi:hypothetical protein
MHRAKSTVRLRRRVASAATAAGLAVVVMGAPAAATAADPPRVDINQISIVGSPKLFIAKPGSTGSAFVVFQTRPRLRTVRQVVVEINGNLGRSYTSRGRAGCVRSTFLNVQPLKAGSRYRVRFYARSGRAGKIEKLITTRTLTARGFAGRPAALPDCRI